MWGGIEGHMKWALVDWHTMCKPKDVGGLGLRELVNINRVLGEKYGGNGFLTQRNPD